MAELDEPIRVAALDFADRMASFWDRRLGPRLKGFYLIGSLAHGGFSRRYSDIDMALIAEDGLAAMRIRAGCATHAFGSCAGAGGEIVAVLGGSNFSVGRFPPLDRVDLVDHAVALWNASGFGRRDRTCGRCVRI